MQAARRATQLLFRPEQAQGAGVVLTTYGRASGFCIDPIEKKPLNHFYPGTTRVVVRDSGLQPRLPVLAELGCWLNCGPGVMLFRLRMPPGGRRGGRCRRLRSLFTFAGDAFFARRYRFGTGALNQRLVRRKVLWNRNSISAKSKAAACETRGRSRGGRRAQHSNDVAVKFLTICHPHQC
jgi:hypothetical protein